MRVKGVRNEQKNYVRKKSPARNSHRCQRRNDRGGGYIWAESACRVSYRDWDLPNYRFSGVGFRLAQ